MLKRIFKLQRAAYAIKTIPTPYMADSITQGTLGSWEKKVGDLVRQDDLIANIETDKVTIPVNCPETGKLIELCAKEGDTVEVGSNLFKIDTDAVVSDKKSDTKNSDNKTPPTVNNSKQNSADHLKSEMVAKNEDEKKGPSKPENLANSGKPEQGAIKSQPNQKSDARLDGRLESREKMTRMRQRIAERMKDAQNTAASLTTFNEVDMSAVMAIRAKHKEAFQKEHGVKLGYMSMFMRAASMGLQEIPIVNARIDPDTKEIIVPAYVDISVAVATSKGLVTPVIRNCDKKSFAELEKELADYGAKARDNKISIEDLTGGTFTISNGGVFGSMMGTPILNMPQVAILGMHAIKDRPVVVDGQIVIRPMMYLALTYDHRVIDGREAATFLVRVKELLEDPYRFLLDL